MSGKPGGSPAVHAHGGASLALSAAVLRRAAKPPVKHERRTPAHLACMTALTRTGKRDYGGFAALLARRRFACLKTNRKPYRTKLMKAMAKRTARKGDDGVFRSAAPVRFHT